MKEYLKNSLAQSHDLARGVVSEGDTVIDATAGNGNDTVFLAGLVGEKGRVYAFDIQRKAIESTRARLIKNNLSERVILIEDGHQNMDRHVTGPVKAVMFNLGYLPGGDHSIGTRAETTIQAMKKSLTLLMPGGLLIMVVYYGGDSGFEEKERVLSYIKEIDPKSFTVMQTEFVNQVNCPPILVCIEKLNKTS